MNNEIKEILELHIKNDIDLLPENQKTVLDYITNLKQELEIMVKDDERSQETIIKLSKENERLKEREKELSYHLCLYSSEETLLKQIDDYKSRIEKAVEYIMSELVDEWSIKNDGCVDGSDLPVNAITPILNILNGRSDE